MGAVAELRILTGCHRRARGSRGRRALGVSGCLRPHTDRPWAVRRCCCLVTDRLGALGRDFDPDTGSHWVAEQIWGTVAYLGQVAMTVSLPHVPWQSVPPGLGPAGGTPLLVGGAPRRRPGAGRRFTASARRWRAAGKSKPRRLWPWTLGSQRRAPALAARLDHRRRLGRPAAVGVLVAAPAAGFRPAACGRRLCRCARGRPLLSSSACCATSSLPLPAWTRRCACAWRRCPRAAPA